MAEIAGAKTILDRSTKRSLAELIDYTINIPGLSYHKFHAMGGDPMLCALGTTLNSTPVTEALLSAEYLCHFSRKILATGHKILQAHSQLTSLVPEHLAVPDADKLFRDATPRFMEEVLPTINRFLDVHGEKGDLKEMLKRPSPLSESGTITIGSLCVQYVGEKQGVHRKGDEVLHPKFEVYRIFRADGQRLPLVATFANWAELAAHIAADKMMPDHWRRLLIRLKKAPLESVKAPSTSNTASKVTEVAPAPPLNTQTLNADPQINALRNLVSIGEALKSRNRGGAGQLDSRIERACEGIMSYVTSRVPEGTLAVLSQPSQEEAFDSEALARAKAEARGELELLLNKRSAELGEWEEQLAQREAAAQEAVTSAEQTMANASHISKLVEMERQGSIATLEIERAALARQKRELEDIQRTFQETFKRLGGLSQT